MISYSGNTMINTNTADDDIYDDDTPESTQNPADKEEKELTLADVVESLQDNHQLMDKMLGNLTAYIEAISSRCKEDPTLIAITDRAMMNILSARFNH